VVKRDLAGRVDEHGLVHSAVQPLVPVGASYRECPQRGAGTQNAVTVLEEQLPLMLDQMVVAPVVAMDLQLSSSCVRYSRS
jgi:hypothetical protein